ncbi:MAG: hypothetical protein IT480_03925 [Gammaproteobacteria bacterium]|nr:hypothetical protein [Gammaproteobacteria bacterium]
MNESRIGDLAERAAALLGTIGRLGGTLSGLVGERATRMVSAFRLEVRQVATAFALALLAAVFAIAAAAFVAVAVLATLWATHPVLGAALVAGGFALLAIIAVLLMRNATRPAGRGRR